MRRHRRRYLAPGQAWVRPAAAAASPGAAADAGVAGPGHGLALGSAADSRAREHRCPAAGKTLMSAPVSAIRSWALVTPKPGMAAQPGDLPLAGLAEGRDPRVQHGDLAGQAAGVADHHRQDEGVPGVKKEQSRASASRAAPARIRPRASSARTAGFGSPAMMA